jgi:hypothetical protein
MLTRLEKQLVLQLQLLEDLLLEVICRLTTPPKKVAFWYFHIFLSPPVTCSGFLGPECTITQLLSYIIARSRTKFEGEAGRELGSLPTVLFLESG